MDNREKNINDECPNCKKGKLESISANEPYTQEHLICNVCDSTYPIKKVMKIKVSEILKQNGLASNDVKTRLKNGQISLNSTQLKCDTEIEVNDDFKIQDAGDFIFNNIAKNETRTMMCKVIGFEELFSDELNFSNELTEFLKRFKHIKISKKESLIIG